jgi:hypothetical protein
VRIGYFALMRSGYLVLVRRGNSLVDLLCVEQVPADLVRAGGSGWWGYQTG